jgi:hypothetical protein
MGNGSGYGDGNRCLADTARPHQRRKAPRAQQSRDGANEFGSANNAHRNPWQTIRLRFGDLERRWLRRYDILRDRSDKRIPAPWNSRQISPSRLSVAKGSSQCGNVDPEATFLDVCIRPNIRHQLFFGNKFARTTHQGDEDVTRAAAEAKAFRLQGAIAAPARDGMVRTRLSGLASTNSREVPP